MATTDDNDAYLSNNSDDGSQYGFLNVLDLDPASVLPLGGAAKDAYTGITEHEWADGFSALADLAGNAVSVWADPLNWLISAGLTFLIDFVQPLEDLLSLVTGNAERMEPYADTWEELGKALVPLAAGIRQAATDHLIDWEGKDAQAAKARLLSFADAVEATGGEAASISGLLTLFSKLMAAAQQLIIGIIATLVEWMIIEWGAAIGLSIPTLGASVTAASAATAVQSTAAVSRGVRIIDQVVRIIFKINALMTKILPGPLKAQVGKSIEKFVTSPASMSTVARVAGDVLGSAGSYVGPVLSSGVAGWKAARPGEPDPSDAQIDDALDVKK